ncbi:MAG: NAD(P)/FAD-dependent oxidoreductase, partial [Bacteroidota bacterium]
KEFGVIIVGGGAAGIFSSIHCADRTAVSVAVFESTSKILDKVLRSGGGRCNVMHNVAVKTKELTNKGYPRGRRELLSTLEAGEQSY